MSLPLRAIHIGLDATEANVTNRVGSNVFAFHIISKLELLTRKRQNIIWTIFLTQPPVGDMPTERPGWRYQLLKPSAFATQFALPLYLYLHKKEFDVFFTPGHYAPRWCPVPYACTIMDLAYEKFPLQFKKKDYLQLSHWTRYSVKHASHVFAISQSTKKDIVDFYHLPAEQVSVAYPSLSLNKNSDSPTWNKMIEKWQMLHQPYFLYVGTLQPRKNLVRVVTAFERVKATLHSQQHPLQNVQLVLAGKVGWLAEETLVAIAESEFTKDIHQLGYVTDIEKTALYSHAEATLLVGLYEGFGMPALESLAVGTLPIVSNTSSLPEVVGESGVLVNPESEKEIAMAMVRALLVDEKHRQELKRNAALQVQKFSWQESAEHILQTMLTLPRT